MKKLLLFLIVLVFTACATSKKTAEANRDRYHDFSGFSTNKTRPMWTGW